MLFLGCCWLQDPSSVIGTWFSFSGVLYTFLYQKGVQHTTSFYQSINLGKAHTEAPMSPASPTATRFPCIDKWNTGPTTTTHHPTMNTFSLTPWPPPMSPLSFFPQVALSPKKTLLAVFLNIFHGFFLQLTPWSCNKVLILASSAHNDSFQYICCISACTCYMSMIWNKHIKNHQHRYIPEMDRLNNFHYENGSRSRQSLFF